MKKKFPRFLAMSLIAALLCSSVVFAAPSPGREDIEIDDPDVPLVEIPTTTVETEAAVSEDGTATVTVTADELLAAAAAVNEEGSVRITVTAAGAEDAAKVTAVLPKEALRAVAGQTDADLHVDTAAGQVTLPNAALASIAEAAGGSDVSVAVETQSAERGAVLLEGKVDVDPALVEAGTVVEVSVTSGDAVISSWEGGAATLDLPVSSEQFQAGMQYTTHRVTPTGEVQTLVGVCMEVNGKLCIRLIVDGLGTFVVLPEAAADAAVAAAGTGMVMSPLASRTAEHQAADPMAAVQQWCDTAVRQMFAL